MARLFVHGHKVADFEKEGFTTYRLMSDGKWLKSKVGGGWKLARFIQGVNPFDALISRGFAVEVYEQQDYLRSRYLSMQRLNSISG